MTTVKYSLLIHGRDTVTYQYSMKNLADNVMELYALNSVIARASRSYSIGLSSSQFEIDLAHLQSHESNVIINNYFNEILKLRMGLSLDNTKTNVADNIFKKGKQPNNKISNSYIGSGHDKIKLSSKKYFNEFKKFKTTNFETGVKRLIKWNINSSKIISSLN